MKPEWSDRFAAAVLLAFINPDRGYLDEPEFLLNLEITTALAKPISLLRLVGSFRH